MSNYGIHGNHSWTNNPMLPSITEHPKLTQIFSEVVYYSACARLPGVCCIEISGSVKKRVLETHYSRIDLLVLLLCHRVIVITSSPKRPQPNNKDIVIINTAQMLRAVYDAHSGIFSSQKSCCSRIDFFQYFLFICSIPRVVSFLLFFNSSF